MLLKLSDLFKINSIVKYWTMNGGILPVVEFHKGWSAVKKI